MRQRLEERANYLAQVVKEKEMALSVAPEGALRVKQGGNYIEYYLREKPQDKSGRYLKVNERDIVPLLAQKGYDERIVKSAKQELGAIHAYLSRVPRLKMEDIYESLNEGRKSMVTPIRLPDEQFVNAWLETDYRKKPIANIGQCYRTTNGEWVRSKSEWMIAELLREQSVPYRYEYPLFLEGYGTVYPDFCILNVRTRKEYYWEHFGMMSDPEYAESTMQKLATYGANSFFLGKNLICTFETKNHGLNVDLVKQMIAEYLK